MVLDEINKKYTLQRRLPGLLERGHRRGVQQVPDPADVRGGGSGQANAGGRGQDVRRPAPADLPEVAEPARRSSMGGTHGSPHPPPFSLGEACARVPLAEQARLRRRDRSIPRRAVSYVALRFGRVGGRGLRPGPPLLGVRGRRVPRMRAALIREIGARPRSAMPRARGRGRRGRARRPGCCAEPDRRERRRRPVSRRASAAAVRPGLRGRRARPRSGRSSGRSARSGSRATADCRARRRAGGPAVRRAGRPPTLPCAASLGIAGLAGWMPVAWRAPVRAGETVLVLGATGTVGLVAVQAARLLGAGRIVAAGRERRRARARRSHGADAIVKLDGDDVAERLREA